MADLLAAATAEIVRLRDVIEGWFTGRLAEDRFDPDFADALHPEFENIQPSGLVGSREDLLDSLRAAHGANPDFRITIEEPRLLAVYPGLILAGYIEAQTGARNSPPENRRRSTVLFETGDRLIWRYLQETALPG
jgi:hypothetical protein